MLKLWVWNLLLFSSSFIEQLIKTTATFFIYFFHFNFIFLLSWLKVLLSSTILVF